MNILTHMNKEKKKQKKQDVDPRITLRVINGVLYMIARI